MIENEPSIIRIVLDKELDITVDELKSHVDVIIKNRNSEQVYTSPTHFEYTIV